MTDTTISPTVRVELDRLAGLYGDDVSKVGAIDGTEDDWGDLLGELATLIGIDCEDGRAWDRFLDAAQWQADLSRTIEQLYLGLLDKYEGGAP